METMSIDEQVELDELYAERDDLFQELIDMAKNNDYDFAEIETINSDIHCIDEKVLKIRRKYSNVLKRLHK